MIFPNKGGRVFLPAEVKNTYRGLENPRSFEDEMHRVLGDWHVGVPHSFSVSLIFSDWSFTSENQLIVRVLDVRTANKSAYYKQNMHAKAVNSNKNKRAITVVCKV